MGMPPLLGGISGISLSEQLRRQYDSESKNLSQLQQAALMNGLGDQLRNKLTIENMQRALRNGTDLSQIQNIHSSAEQYYKYLGNLQARRNNYVADGNNEWTDRNSETRRFLRDYWSVRVGNNSHYKNLRDFDSFVSNLEKHFQANPQFIPLEKIQQEHSNYLIERANEQALTSIYRCVAERTVESKRRIIEVSGILAEELRRDQTGDTCTQRFIDQL